MISSVHKITLFVSKGVEQIELPDLVDKSIEEATTELTELGIQFTVIPVFNNEYDPGVIISTDPEAGTMMDKNNGTVLLKIKKEVIEDESDERDDQTSKSKNSKSSSKSSKSSSKSGKSSSSEKSSSKRIKNTKEE